MSGVWERVRDVGRAVVEWGVRTLASPVRDAVAGVADLIGDQLGEVLAWLGDAVDGIVQLVLTPIRKAWDLLAEPFRGLFGFLGDLGQAAAAAVRWLRDDFIPGVRSWVMQRVADIAAGLQGVIDGVRRWAADRVRELVDGLAALGRWVNDHVLAPLSRLIEGVRSWAADRVRELVDGLAGLARWVHDQVLVPLANTLNSVVTLIKGRIMAAVQLVEQAWVLLQAVAHYGPGALLTLLLPGRLRQLFGELVDDVRRDAGAAVGALDDLADEWLR